MIGRYRDGVVPEAEPPAALAADVRGPGRGVPGATRRGRAERGARRDLARVRAAEPRSSRTSEPWKLAKDDAAGRPARRGPLRARRGPARGLRAAPPVHARHARSGCSPRSAARTARSRRARFGAVRRRRRLGELGQLFPKVEPPPADDAVGRVIDTHCHLDACKPPDAELVARARAAGVSAARDGRDGRRVDRARARRGRTRTRRWSRSSAATRTRPRASTTHDLEPIERAAADPARPRDRRDRARLLPRLRAARPTSGARSRPRSSSPRELGLPLVIHTRAAEDDTFAMLRERAGGLTVIMHCFSAPDRLDECVERG